MTWCTARRALWALVVMAAGSVGAASLGLIASPGTPPDRVVSGVADIGGSFRLTTHMGKTLTDQDLKGRPFLVFFGFTHCPEICPTTLMELTERYRRLGSDADKLTTLFITVDPERDTQQVLSTYMDAFDPRFIALRGGHDEIDAIARSYKAYVRKVPTEDGGNYTMDHNAIVYLMDRNGRFVQSLDPHESEDTQLRKLRRLIAG